MKTKHLLSFVTVLCASLAAHAADSPPKEGASAQAESTAKKEAANVPTQVDPANAAAVSANGSNATNELRMNFRDASLEMVLDYLTEAAGFIINIKPGTSVRGKVNIRSAQPVTREEAVNLLDTALIQNGLAAVRNGRTLTIVNRDEAKTQSIPVMFGADPDKIPITDRIVTQIMPLRFVEVAQLVKDIQPLVSMQTTMTANEAGNSLVITDTQANIHRIAEVVHAIDLGAEDFTEVRVFPLLRSSPVEMADLLTNLFPEDNSRSGGSQSPFGGRFGGFFGRGGPGGGNQGGNTSNSQNQRIKKRNRVIAVADQRTASIIVSASRDLMDQIEEVITRIDANEKGQAMVTVLRTPNADPNEIRQVLQDLFNKKNTQNNRNSANQNSALQQRSSTQSQQNNSNSRTTLTPNSGGRGGNTPSFQ